MKYLFNSRGEQISNLVGEHLHAPTGENIGHYLSDQGIFIDMSGRYLGEIVCDNRLMFNNACPFGSMNFGNFGNYGNIGKYGNPGNYGRLNWSDGKAEIPRLHADR